MEEVKVPPPHQLGYALRPLMGIVQTATDRPIDFSNGNIIAELMQWCCQCDWFQSQSLELGDKFPFLIRLTCVYMSYEGESLTFDCWYEDANVCVAFAGALYIMLTRL